MGGESLELSLENPVIVAAEGVDRNVPGILLLQPLQRALTRRIIHAEHDGRARLRPQRERALAPFSGRGEPIHIAMAACGYESGKALFAARITMQSRDAADLKTQGPRPLLQRLFGSENHGRQKSRSA